MADRSRAGGGGGSSATHAAMLTPRAPGKLSYNSSSSHGQSRSSAAPGWKGQAFRFRSSAELANLGSCLVRTLVFAPKPTVLLPHFFCHVHIKTTPGVTRGLRRARLAGLGEHRMVTSFPLLRAREGPARFPEGFLRLCVCVFNVFHINFSAHLD